MKNLTTSIIALSFFFGLNFFVSAQEIPKLNDAEIAHISVVANQIDISYAKIAKIKSSNKEIIEFAETMERDHNGVIGQATDLVNRLGVNPKDNPVSKSLLSNAEKTKALLNSKSGKEFDKAYIDNEVIYHESVISAVKDLLIPQAQNYELKELLKVVLPALEVHLGHAKMVQKSIK